MAFDKNQPYQQQTELGKASLFHQDGIIYNARGEEVGREPPPPVEVEVEEAVAVVEEQQAAVEDTVSPAEARLDMGELTVDPLEDAQRENAQALQAETQSE